MREEILCRTDELALILIYNSNIYRRNIVFSLFSSYLVSMEVSLNNNASTVKPLALSICSCFLSARPLALSSATLRIQGDRHADGRNL